MIYLLPSIIYLVLLLFTITFQVGLIAGKPWGEWTMGGYNKGVLPSKLKVAPLISVLILTFFCVVIANRVNLFGLNLDLPNWVSFSLIGFNILAVFANSITQSQKEKKLWQPITFAMLLCSLWLFVF